MADKDWIKKFLAACIQVFPKVKQDEKNRPLRQGDVVLWVAEGVRPNDRAFTILQLLEDDRAVIEGWVDGRPEMPDIITVPRAHIARAAEILQAVESIDIIAKGCYN